MAINTKSRQTAYVTRLRSRAARLRQDHPDECLRLHTLADNVEKGEAQIEKVPPLLHEKELLLKISDRAERLARARELGVD